MSFGVRNQKLEKDRGGLPSISTDIFTCTESSFQPQPELNDRAADVWEPLLAVVDIAGDYWAREARLAAAALAESAVESNPVGSLFLDIYLLFTQKNTDRLFTRELVGWLNGFQNHAWAERKGGRPINEQWLAQQLRPYGIRPRLVRSGEAIARGYYLNDCKDSFRRYISRAEFNGLRAELEQSDVRGDGAPAPREENGQ